MGSEMCIRDRCGGMSTSLADEFALHFTPVFRYFSLDVDTIVRYFSSHLLPSALREPGRQPIAAHEHTVRPEFTPVLRSFPQFDRKVRLRLYHRSTRREDATFRDLTHASKLANNHLVDDLRVFQRTAIPHKCDRTYVAGSTTFLSFRRRYG